MDDPIPNLIELLKLDELSYINRFLPIRDRLQFAAVNKPVHSNKHILYGEAPAPFHTWTEYGSWINLRRNEAIMPVAAADDSTAFVTRDGTLMFWKGWRYRRPELTQLLRGTRIRNIGSGIDFNVAVSNEGDVYTWGSCALLGNKGQLGRGDGEALRAYNIPLQVQALAQHKILSVATGYHHCIAVAETGDVFSWGNDPHGQCGHGTRSDIAAADRIELIPRRIADLVGVRARNASASYSYSLVVTEEGKLYSFGHTPFLEGSAAEQQTPHLQTTPKIIYFHRNARIKSTAAGIQHVIALTETGEVFAWGNNRRGQLGLGTVTADALKITVPQRIAFADPDEACTVSSVNAYNHVSCAVTNSGKLFMWGLVFPPNSSDAAHDGTFSTFPQGRFLNRPTIVSPKHHFVIAVSPRTDRTLMLIERDGVRRVVGWGLLDNKQFGHGRVGVWHTET